MKNLSLLTLTAALALQGQPRRAEGEPDPKHAQNLQNLLAKHSGDAMALIGTLLGEAATYRETIRTQKDSLEKAALPEGAVVLSKEQAEQFTAYQKLGSPADVEKSVTDGKAATEKLTMLEKREGIRAVADKVGYKAGVLEKLGGDLTYEEMEVDGEKAGEKVKTYGVKGADGKVTPLSTYAKDNWGDFLPALTAGEGRQQQQESAVRVALGGAGSPATTSRTPDQIAADKRASGDYSM